MRTLRIVCLAALSVFGCTNTKPTISGDDFVGCYKVTSQRYEPGSALRNEVDVRIVTDTTKTPWGTFPKVLERSPSGTFVDNNGYWKIQRNGKINLIWSNNSLSGFEMVLQPKGRNFEGVAHEFWDVAPNITNPKKIWLERKPCEP